MQVEALTDLVVAPQPVGKPVATRKSPLTLWHSPGVKRMTRVGFCPAPLLAAQSVAEAKELTPHVALVGTVPAATLHSTLYPVLEQLVLAVVHVASEYVYMMLYWTAEAIAIKARNSIFQK